VDEKDKTLVTDRLASKKSTLLTWLNSYLADQTLESLHGSAGMNRVRRKIREEFNARLFGDDSDKIKDVLMPLYLFQ
jgi:flagellar basal body-associated protein FliL